MPFLSLHDKDWGSRGGGKSVPVTSVSGESLARDGVVDREAL